MEVDDKTIDRAVHRFLNSGAVGELDESTLAHACSRRVRQMNQRSIKKASNLAAKFVRRARPISGVLLSTALRTQGWCFLIGGHYEQAEAAYLEARALLVRDPLWRGRVDRVLIDIYMYLGDYKEARRRARLGVATFGRAGRPDETAKTRVNLANLLHRQDCHIEARREYERAARLFEKTDEKLTLALCRYNYANTLVQLFEMDAACDLYAKAEAAFSDLGYDLFANECHYGQAFLSMLRGDYYQALAGLAGCESVYRTAGQPRGVLLCTLDRAEAFLGLNLFSDASEAAHTAERQARKLKFRYEAGKAALFLSKAAHAMGDAGVARRAILRAQARFAEEGNRAFQGVSILTQALAETSQTKSAAALEDARAQFSSAQLPLWEAICDLQLAWRQPENAAILKRLRRNRAVMAVPHLYAQWQTLLGDRAACRGRLAQAEKHWLQGARMLDAVRAKLPPLELRTAFLQHRGHPYLRLIKIYSKDDPSKAAAWSERYKTVGVWAPLDSRLESHAERRRAETSLAELAASVTAVSAHLSGTVGERGTHRPQSHSAWLKMIDRVRYDIARAEPAVAPAPIEELITDFEKVGRQLPIVQFHCDESDLVAFVQRKGTVTCRRYEDGRRRLRQFLGLWHILLGRALLSDGHSAPADIAEERRLFTQLGEWLWTPLEIDRDERNVLILPEGRLANLPWSALLTGQESLGDRHTLILAPSLRHYLHARRIRVRSQRMQIFVGQLEGLEHSVSELEAFNTGSDIDLHWHNPCCRADWPDNQSARLWHYTGHAELRTDNPFFSSLRLQDGPLFAADFRLKRNRVGLVTLAACRTGQQMYLPGEEATGMVRSLLEMGARSVIASHWAAADESTAFWMREFYRCYLTGLPVGEAMQWAMAAVREERPSAYHWAAFSIYGAI